MTQSAINAATSKTGSYGHLLKLRFASGDVNLTTFGGSVTFAGDSYSAIGGNFSIGAVHDSADPAAQSFTLQLDGVDRSVLTLILGNHYIGRTLTVWRAYKNPNTSLVADPVQLGTFYMNGSWVYEEQHNELGAVTALIRTTASSRLIVGQFIRGIITNLQSHQKHFPLDRFYRYIAKMSEGAPIIWGGKTVFIGNRRPPPHS